MTISIDDDIRGLIPKLQDYERAQLEENLQRDGCRDPLVVWLETGILLDGHNRKEICHEHGIPFKTRSVSLPDRDAAKQWVIQNQLGRRNLTPYQRMELALVLKPLIIAKAKENESQGGKTEGSANSPKGSIDTREELARLADVGSNTLSRTQYIIEHADEATQEKLRRGETTINHEYLELKRAEAKEARAARKAAAAAEPPSDDRCRLICADVADAIGLIDAASVDWIVTDPPYGKQYLDLYDRLAELAVHALKSGGSLIAMVGQSYLPDIMARFAAHLEYHWTLAYLTPGGQAAQLWDRRVNTFWKPLLWYVNGQYEGDWVGDVCRSDVNDNDKDHHKWGQSESGVADILERFTDPGQTILDPFVGGGTTGRVAVHMDRRFIGLDADPAALARAAEFVS